MTLVESLATLNACLNGASLVCLTLGFIAIKRQDRSLHKSFMTGAFVLSIVFLVSYLTRYAMSGNTLFPGSGWQKGLYFFVLFTHIPLAALVVPLCIRALTHAWKGRFEAHKKVARWLWPVWSYVSVTGVLVYLMLYHWV